MADIKIPTNLVVSEIYEPADSTNPHIRMFRCDIPMQKGFLVQSTPVYGKGDMNNGLTVGAVIDMKDLNVREKPCTDGVPRLWLSI